MLFGKSKAGGVQWLAVFLGNPGAKYAASRHNAGFMTCDALTEKLGLKGVSLLKYHALTGRCEIGGQQVMLMKPQTYMNLSGDSVVEAARFFKIPPERVLVVSDEVALPVGKLRIRKGGSAGGHNGLKSIIQQLGTEDFPRVRIGVGSPPHPDYDMADWVLAGFHGEDAKLMADAVSRAADAVETYISDGPDKAMNRFN